MQWIATFIVLAVLGIADAGYLTLKHREKKPLACPLDHDCSHVTESKWATIFGVRNEVLGLLFYVALLVGALLLLTFPSYAATLRTLFLLATAGGFLFSAFLTMLQFAVIKDYCFYCLISAGINGLLVINAWVLFREGGGIT